MPEGRGMDGGAVALAPASRRLLAQVERAAASDLAVVLCGESGSGKSFWAAQIHLRSRRANRPLAVVDTAGIPAALLESELFGHAKGAFTDALGARPGRLELAHGGTVVFDNLAELDASLQAKLLRVLDGGSVSRLGETQARALDLRFIACAPLDIERLVESGAFRRDLYYRLNVLPLAVPSLRDRPQDIIPLAELFLKRFVRAFGKRNLRLSPRAARLLEDWPWPGNVRELEHCMERAAVEAPAEGELGPESFPSLFSRPLDAFVEDASRRELTLAEMERLYAERVLAQCGGNLTRAAQVLGISRSTLYFKTGRRKPSSRARKK